MATIDILILIPLLFGAYKGFKKGLLMELVSLIALCLATILSFKLLEQGVELLAPYLGKNESILPYISFVLIFVLVMFLVTYMGKAIKKFMDITLVGKLDDLAGALLGALKWAFGFSILVWLTESAGLGLPQDYTQESLFYPIMVSYGPKVMDVLSMILPFAKDTVQSIKDLLYVQPS